MLVGTCGRKEQWPNMSLEDIDLFKQMSERTVDPSLHFHLHCDLHSLLIGWRCARFIYQKFKVLSWLTPYNQPWFWRSTSIACYITYEATQGCQHTHTVQSLPHTSKEKVRLIVNIRERLSVLEDLILVQSLSLDIGHVICNAVRAVSIVTYATLLLEESDLSCDFSALVKNNACLVCFSRQHNELPLLLERSFISCHSKISYIYIYIWCLDISL